MSRRNHFDSGHGKPEHTFEVEDRGEDWGDERYKMALNTPDFSHAATVTYDIYHDPHPTLEVSYLKSHIEGKGHARKLMENLYQKYPKHFIDWGLTISPASAHLASQFEDKYYDRTAYRTSDDF